MLKFYYIISWLGNENWKGGECEDIQAESERAEA